MRNVLVTVVIPAFNRASRVEVALRSIQAQSCADWEAIVVDDASRDRTADAVMRFARDDGRITLRRHDQNRGAQAARNTGIRNARGRWIAFLDSDDRWLGHSLRLRLDAANKDQLQVVHSGAYQIGDDGSTVVHHIPPLEGWVRRALLRAPGPMLQGLLVTRDALGRIGDLDERLVAQQEWDTTIRLAEHYRFGFVATPTFVWDRRGTDTITKDRSRDARGYEQVVCKHFHSMIRSGGPQVVADHFDILATRYQRVGDRAATLRSWLIATCCSPHQPRRAARRLRHLLASSSRSAAGEQLVREDSTAMPKER